MNQELRVCLDIGSESHYAVVGLTTGQVLDAFAVSHNPQGIRKFFDHVDKLSKKHQLPVSVAMEAYNGYARPIDQMVLDKGYRLFNVNNHKLARYKEIFPGPSKSDPIDAKTIFELFNMNDDGRASKNTLQEILKVPEINEQLKHFTRERRQLVHDKVRLSNRMHADLHAAAPGLIEATGNIANKWFLNFLTSVKDFKKLKSIQLKTILKIKGVGRQYALKIRDWQKSALFSTRADEIGEFIIKDAKRLLRLIEEIEDLEKRIKIMGNQSRMCCLLQSIPGFGSICAAELAGEIGTYARFKSEASLALYLGVAVVDMKSGKSNRSKAPYQINKRGKLALITGMARHIEASPEAKRYYDKKRAEGKKHNQALRSLGRHMVRVIWSMLLGDREYQLRESASD